MDEEFIKRLENISATLKTSAEEMKKQIHSNAVMDDATKSFMSFLAHVTLNGIAALYDLEALNTARIYGLKGQAREVNLSQNDYDFIKWERRYREDQARDTETSNGNTYHT